MDDGIIPMTALIRELSYTNHIWIFSKRKPKSSYHNMWMTNISRLEKWSMTTLCSSVCSIKDQYHESFFDMSQLMFIWIQKWFIWNGTTLRETLPFQSTDRCNIFTWQPATFDCSASSKLSDYHKVWRQKTFNSTWCNNENRFCGKIFRGFFSCDQWNSACSRWFHNRYGYPFVFYLWMTIIICVVFSQLPNRIFPAVIFVWCFRFMIICNDVLYKIFIYIKWLREIRVKLSVLLLLMPIISIDLIVSTRCLAIIIMVIIIINIRVYSITIIIIIMLASDVSNTYHGLRIKCFHSIVFYSFVD